jgi:hypothetical protein
MSGSENRVGFAPSDPTDDRKPGEWRSRYEPDARREIRIEGIYLGALLCVVAISILLFWLGYPKQSLHWTSRQYDSILYYGLAWLGGTLGGTLFDLKWLYHSVARGLWNLDRRLWRIFTPHISGALSFAVVALMSAGVIRIFDSESIKSSYPTVVGLSFLIGYFSDNAIAKLSEIATTLFGDVKLGKKPSSSQGND